MFDVLPVVAAHAAIFFVAGLPFALAARSTRDGAGWVAVDALAHGLIFTVLGIVLNMWVGAAGLVLVVLAWVAAIVVAVLRRPVLPGMRMPRGREWLLVGAWAAVLVGSLVLRLRNSTFLPWTGDMGAYVNWANEYVRLGEFKASWPPFFPAYLSMSSALFGPALTTASVPFTGILLILVIARLTRKLGAGPWSTLVVAGLVGVSVHAIWFSSFPASESLNAPLFVAWAGTIIAALTAERRQVPVWLFLAGSGMLALGLLRGTAPLFLIPLIAFAVIAVAAPDWRRHAVRLWLAFGASLIGALVSFWYGIEKIPRYYVTNQVQDLLPGPLFNAAGKLGLFDPTVVTALVLVVVVVVVVGLGLFFARRFEAHDRPSRAPRVMGWALGIALAFGLAADAFVNADVWNILLRAGLWLSLATIGYIFHSGRLRPQGDIVVGFVFFLGFLVAIFLAIHTVRLKLNRGHDFHLYWDRYIFSEILPVLFVVLGLALTAVWQAGLRSRALALLGSPSRMRRAVPAVAVVALLAAVVVPTAHALRLVTQDAYMNGAYAFEQKLIGLLPDSTTPVAWAATTEGKAPGFFFPNTYMAFAKPMQRSFGVDVINIGGRGSDFSPDQVYDLPTLVQEARCAETGELVIFETETGGTTIDQRISSPGLDFEPLGTVTSDISLLKQEPTADWTEADITVNAWVAHFSADLLAGAPECPAA